MERGRSGRDRDRVLDAAGARELGLELGDLRAHRQLARLEHRRDLRQLLGADVGPREPDQVSAGFRSRYHAIVLASPSSSSTCASKPSSCARLVDVRDPQLDVGVVERLEADLARRSR